MQLPVQSSRDFPFPNPTPSPKPSLPGRLPSDSCSSEIHSPRRSALHGAVCILAITSGILAHVATALPVAQRYHTQHPIHHRRLYPHRAATALCCAVLPCPALHVAADLGLATPLTIVCCTTPACRRCCDATRFHSLYARALTRNSRLFLRRLTARHSASTESSSSSSDSQTTLRSRPSLFQT